jgi:hypothetical protein
MDDDRAMSGTLHVRLCRTPSPQGQCQEEGYQSYQGSEIQTLTGHHVMVTYDN